MIKIKIATVANAEVLALLGRITYAESHAHFINNENDLAAYCKEEFSVSKMKKDLNNPNYLFYITYVDDLPVGYVKLVLNTIHENIVSKNNCCLEKIYILNEFIPLKIGQQLLTFVVEKVKELQLDIMWLTVYIKNIRAIRFYERNEFKDVGKLNFIINGKDYENIIFSKKNINMNRA